MSVADQRCMSFIFLHPNSSRWSTSKPISGVLQSAMKGELLLFLQVSMGHGLGLGRAVISEAREERGVG